MVTVFVKELDREVEVVEVSGCPLIHTPANSIATTRMK